LLRISQKIILSYFILKIELKKYEEKKDRGRKAAREPSHTISPEASDIEECEEEAEVEETDVEDGNEASDEEYDEDQEEGEEEEEEEEEEIELKGEKPKKTSAKITKKAVIKRPRAPTGTKATKDSIKVGSVYNHFTV
jgi:hypothetical protein